MGNGSCTCFTGYAGPACQYSDAVTCNGHGTVQADGSCACNSGFAGASCNTCAANYYNYPTCTFCQAATTCNGNGTCSPQGTCSCFPGFTGANCQTAATTTTSTTTTSTTSVTSSTIATSTTSTTTTLPEDTGLVPPSAAASKCEDAVVKSVAKFAAAILKCHTKAADAAFKNASFAEEPCEVAAAAKYDATNTKLFAPGHCPACLQANAVGMRQTVESVLDGINGQAYCAGTVPLP